MMQRTVLIFACLFSLLAPQADATMIFHRPAADPFTAGSFFSDVSRPREAASSFVLDADADVQTIAWQGGYFDSATPGATTAFVIQFFEDSGGMPSNLPFASADVLADVVELPGVVVEYAYSALLPHAQPLPGGVVLWISIAEKDAATDSTFTWRKAGESGTSYSRADATSGWEAFSGSAGFSLSGTLAVPEPGSAALLGIGVLGLASRRARLQRFR